MSKIRDIWSKIQALFEEELGEVGREIVEVDSWDGSPTNYSSTAEYCRACLLDLNSAAGNEEKVQSHCMLPIRREGDAASVFVDRAVFAASGGRGLSAVTRPDDVPEDAWNTAVVRAANALIRAYDEMDRDAPDSLYEIAGREPPSRTITIPVGKEHLARAISSSNLHSAIWNILLEHDRELGQDNWLIDLYFDNDKTYVLVADRGKLYRYDLSINESDVVLSERIEIMEVHQPVTQSRSVIRQQEDGRWRWFAVSATATLNRTGEIDSRDLFDNFSRRCLESGDYPIRDFYHRQAPFRVGVADFIARHGNTLVTSGLYDEDNELAAAEVAARQREPDFWGDSIEFYLEGEPDMVPYGDVEIPVYRDGEIKFISTLPVTDAASWFTVGRVREVRRQMNDAERSAFVRLFDSEEAADTWLEENVNPINRKIERDGMITRDASMEEGAQEDDSEPGDGESGDPDPLIEREVEIDDETLLAIGTAALENSPILTQIQETLTGLGESITSITERLDLEATRSKEVEDATTQRLAELEKDEDEKKREYVEDLPRRQLTRVTHRPRVARGENGEEPAVESMADTATETLGKWER